MLSAPRKLFSNIESKLLTLHVNYLGGYFIYNVIRREKK